MLRSATKAFIALTIAFTAQSALARRPRPAPTPSPTPAPTTQITVYQTNPTSVSAAAGTSFNLTYNFSGGPTSVSETVFVHFVDANDNIIFGDDHQPPTSTTTWSGSRSYTRTIYVPPTVASATYRILVGLYDSTGRLPLLMGSGVTDAGSYRYQVGTAAIQNVVANPTPTPTPVPTPTPTPVPTQVTVNQSNPTSVSAAAGSSFNLTYNFSGGPTSVAETVFVHFVDANDNIVFGDDHTPPTPTTNWNGTISYKRTIWVPSTATGTYKILVGLYDSTGRLPLLMGSGVTDAGSYRYQVGTVAIQSTAPSPTPTPAPTIPSGYTSIPASNYGVRCDGVTDDANAIQNAVNAVASYQAIVLPAGTCVSSHWITLQGKSNVAVVGAGMNSTILKMTNPLSSTFDVYGSNHVLVSDFQVWSPNTNVRTGDGLSRGFYAESSSYVTFQRLKANNVAGAGFLFFVVTDSVIQDSEDYYSWADAFHVTGGSQRITVQRNVATHPGDDCFASIGYTGGRNVDVSMLDNTCSDGPWGGGVSFEGNLRGKAYRNKIYRVGVSCFRVTAWDAYPVEPNDQIDFQDNYGENCVTRTDTGHGAVMIFTDVNNITNVTFQRTTIVNPMTGTGVRAFGSNGATVQADFSNGTITGASRCFSIESGATVTQSGNTCN